MEETGFVSGYIGVIGRQGMGRGTNCRGGTKAEMRRKKCEDVHKRASQKAKRQGPRRDGDGWREGFNWALGSGTCSDNIKGQIYIKCCWERMTRVRKCCWAEGRQEDTGRKATTGKKDLEERKGEKKIFSQNAFHIHGPQNKKGNKSNCFKVASDSQV